MSKNTFIIVTWNSEKQIMPLLESIHNYEKESVVIVFDNASNDKTVEIIKKRNFKNVRIIESKTNLGFSKANNLAVKCANTEYVTIINPDTRILQSTVNTLCNQYTKNVGIISAKLINTNGTVQPSVFAFQNPATLFFEQFGIGKYLPNGLKQKLSPENYIFEDVTCVDWVMGAFMLMKKSVYMSIDGFSEDYFMYSEDMDICYKCHLKGYDVLFNPKIEVEHIGGASEVQDVNASKSSKLIRSFLIFADKYNFNKNRKVLIFCYQIKNIILLPLSLLLKKYKIKRKRYQKNLKLLVGWKKINDS